MGEPGGAPSWAMRKARGAQQRMRAAQNRVAMTSRELDEAQAAAGAEVRARQGRLCFSLGTAGEQTEGQWKVEARVHARLECGKGRD